MSGRAPGGAAAIEGVAVEIGPEAVLVRAAAPLTVLSSAIAGGGPGEARTLVNVHVPKGFECEDPAAVLAEFAERRALAAPWVGLLTAAATERAESAHAARGGVAAAAIVTVGLSNAICAGRSAPGPPALSTINAIVIVDARPSPAALVNAVMTVTEVKASVLAEVGHRTAHGWLASGTSTDAVIVAATGRGPACRYGGPISPLGWVVARAAREAIEAGVRRWRAERM